MQNTRMPRKSRLLLLSTLLLIVACAKQGYPTGGPKDVAPPTAVGAKPANETRDFAAHQFFIEFDEYVVLKNPDDNVLVSPPLSQKPEYTTKGHGVLVRLKDTLRANTTYLFQFKEAIADFTEGNVLPSYEYVFSTGDRMDTMMLAGSVANARNGKPWKETLSVLAFRPGDTVPALVTRTDKEGRFAFHYIPEGRYRLVAVEDKNKNLVADSTEAVAWDTTFHAALDSVDSSRMAKLHISAPDRRAQRVLKADFTARGHIVVSTLLPMRQPSVTGEPLQWRLNERRDTLTLWCLNEQCDSTVLVLADEGLQDTLKLRYRPPSGKGRRSSAQQPKEPLMRSLCDGSRAFYDSLMLAFAAPVTPARDILQAEVMSLKDSTVAYYPILLDSSGMRARIMASLRSGEEYRLRVDDSLFTDLYGHPSDSLNFRLTPKDYATLTLHISNRTGHPLLIEVLDSKDTVVQHSTLQSLRSTLKFIHLPAGEYRLRAVVDRNGDGRWTTGDYFLGRQPEDYRLFDKTLQLREKWEMEERWIVDEKASEGVKRRVGAIERNEAKGSDDMKESIEVKRTEGKTGGEKTRRSVGAKGNEEVRKSVEVKTPDKIQ